MLVKVQVICLQNSSTPKNHVTLATRASCTISVNTDGQEINLNLEKIHSTAVVPLAGNAHNNNFSLEYSF